MFGKSPKLLDSVASLVEPGEEVLAAIAVQPKGSGNAQAVGGLLGSAMAARGSKATRDGREATGVELPRFAALAVTSQRVLILKMNGMGSKATEIVSELPVGEVDSLDAGKNALRKTLTLSAHGGSVEMEMHKATKVETVQEAFQQARAAG